VTRPRWPTLAFVALILAGMGLRIAAALRPGLWGDEIFSLAMATGHSLEHPAALAQATLGDFVEPSGPAPPEAFRRYLEFDARPARVLGVLRAVFLSDTSPPLYYLLLSLWSRGFGTGDVALRLFSVACAALTAPLLWLLGRQIGPPRLAGTACLLFSFSPVAIYYSAEGRMYALLWPLASLLSLLTLRLARPGRSSPWPSVGWVVTGAAGLLTHYFFAFVWAACAGWLVISSRPARQRASGLALITLLLVAPWYAQVPASLAQWRVTAGWQDGDLRWPADLARPFTLAAGLLSGRSAAGGWRWADAATGIVFGLAAFGMLLRRRARRLFARRQRLVWAWLAAACLGVLAFDLWRHTTTSHIPRYVLGGLPAAALLGAFLLAQLPPKVHGVALAAILLAWLPGARAAASGTPRPQHPFPDIARALESWARPGDLVLVHSVPTGVLGVARYLTRDLPMASWVVQLDQRRMPEDLERLLAGRRRVALVKVHYRGLPAPAEAWLEQHATLLGRETFPASSAQVTYFASADGEPFRGGAPAADPARPGD
jgi:uncharacterized membrane protein